MLESNTHHSSRLGRNLPKATIGVYAGRDGKPVFTNDMVWSSMNILIVNAVEWSDAYLRIQYRRDVSEWISDAFDDELKNVAVWRIQREDTPPVGAFDAVVVSGSSASAFDQNAWIRRLSDAILAWADDGMPLLGICFGHQIVTQALGGRVERNPLGWEVGTHRLALTSAGTSDPLFESLESPLHVMQSHRDIVTEPPPGAITLASSPLCRHQALAIGDYIRTVQFHPEYTAAHMDYLLGPRRHVLSEAGIGFDAMRSGIRETPASRKVMVNFEHQVIRKYNRRENNV